MPYGLRLLRVQVEKISQCSHETAQRIKGVRLSIRALTQLNQNPPKGLCKGSVSHGLTDNHP